MRLAPLVLLTGCHSLVVVAELGDDLSSGTGNSSTAGTTAASTTADDPTADLCDLPAPLACDDGLDPLRALGLGCPGEAPIDATEVLSPEPGGLRTARQFANAAWNPRAGQQLLALSTGVLPAPDPNGLITVPAGSAYPGTANGNPDTTAPPAPVDLDAIADHWPVLQTQDLVALRFDVTVPAGARGFALDLAFFTAEYPRRADLPLGDSLLVWISGESFTGDVAALGTPVRVRELRAAFAANELVGDAPALVGTGFEGLEGDPCDLGWINYPRCPLAGALAWSTLRGAVTPGERLAVVIALADQNDAQRDTVALLDAWRWTCDDCADACGLAPAS